MTRPCLILAAMALLAADPPASDKPMPAEEAARGFTVPPGFKVSVFAAEPNVVQPIAFTFDDRGRLWVAENLSYPTWQTKPGPGTDRVVILEDTDGDGKFDKRTVVLENVRNLSSIALGFGGIYMTCIPELVFVPLDGDKPAGPPKVLLDGWNIEKAQHNVVNGLNWGPDGWLYGLNGIQSDSRVGPPGCPDKDRKHLTCAVWRYHPTRHDFEVVCQGGTNPWGLDWDLTGQAFFTNCVLDHAYQVVPGAIYERMHGQHDNPHNYEFLKGCCDYRHWAGGHWTVGRNSTGAHGEAGGGHAHVGAMVYLGDNWPDEYRGHLYTLNLHGRRMNCDKLSPRGSGAVGTRGPDMLQAADTWFRGIALQYGPDGGVYVSDWSDTGECHNYKVVDRTNGRIFKVTYGDVKPWKGDLTKLSDKELVLLHDHKNEWFVRHARRLLEERLAAGKLNRNQVAFWLEEFIRSASQTQPRHIDGVLPFGGLYTSEPTVLCTRIMYTQHALNFDVSKGSWDKLPEELRSLVVRLHPNDRELQRMAADSTARVRLEAISATQRWPLAERWGMISTLSQHDDSNDRLLPLMLWYTAEPLVATDPVRAAKLAANAKTPQFRRLMARRIMTVDPDALFRTMLEASDPVRADFTAGLIEALRSKPPVSAPVSWASAKTKLATHPDPVTRMYARQVSLLYGDPTALIELSATLADRTAAPGERLAALELLLSRKDPSLVPALHNLLDEPPMRSAALRGLAVFADPAIPGWILAHYRDYTPAEKGDAVMALSSRKESARQLLDAMEAGTVARTDVGAFAARQIAALGDPALAERLARVWGTTRPASADRAALFAKYRKQLVKGTLERADPVRGHALFTQHCGSCHVLFGEGQRVGPELTGSQRTNIEYVLENVLDPSAVVAQEYQMVQIELKSGRVVQGIVKREDGQTLLLQTPTGEVTVAVPEIESRQKSPLSLMPDGLFDKLSADEVRDLVGYLMRN